MPLGYIINYKKNGSDGIKKPVVQSVRIGRSIHCDVRIHVQSVSDQHCLIKVEKDKRARILNLSSNSQTLINGISVGKSGHDLNHGDRFTIGEKSFRWEYGLQTPFYEGQKASPQKRRKSEADLAAGSDNIAVVSPMYHKRRTMGPAVTLSETSRSTKVTSIDLKSGSTKTSAFEKTLSETPILSKSPVIRSPPSGLSQGKTPGHSATKFQKSSPKSSSSRTGVVKTPVLNRTPALKSPASSRTSDQKSASAKSSKQISGVRTPVVKALAALSKSPTAMSPSAKAMSRTSSVRKTPSRAGSTKTPKLITPGVSPQTHQKKRASKSLGSQTPVKTPARKSLPKKKSKSAVKPLKSPKGRKRKLSSPPAVPSKRVKIESPKSIDKKKMAVLMGIHGRSPRVLSSSTLSTVKVVLSGKKTPIIKSIKPASSQSTAKKTYKSTPGSKVKSSMKKKRPTYADIAKKKAVQRANTVARKLALASQAPQVVSKKVEKESLCTVIPQKFKFGSTGHANSPETIFIGRKVGKTPVITKKGRKAPVLMNLKTGGINLSGISEMFKTPAKAKSQEELHSSSVSQRKRSSFQEKSPKASPSGSILLSDSPSRRSVKSSKPLPSTVSPAKTTKTTQKASSPRTSLPPRKTSVSKLSSPEKSTISVKTPGSNASLSSPTSKRHTRSSSASGSVKGMSARKSLSTSKSINQSQGMSRPRRHLSLMTSTPAVHRKRESFADSAFESPSSLLTGQISAPQSPSSGRKARLGMVGSRSSYVHTPHASPVKSSLKSSPPKSPPSGSPSKNLSVSFNDSIHIKMLMPGSRRSLNTTAPLSSPASIIGEDCSGTETPDLTTFDFNSVKTPNVPKEMFVSSILSSGSSNNSQASGSAKRKGKVVKTPHNDLSDLQGVRRLMKTPPSPRGYVDVKGVKRLMSNACKTPTYLAVEGVKKLFCDAAVAAGNELTDFVGVRELFASPSKTKAKTSLCASPRVTLRKSSPVAKIQAEVESKGRSSTGSVASSSKRNSSSPSMSAVREQRDTGGKAIKQEVDSLNNTPAINAKRVTRKTRRASPELSTGASPCVTSGNAFEKEKQERPKRSSSKRGKVSKTTPHEPSTEESTKELKAIVNTASPKKSPTKLCPPRKRTRKTAKAQDPENISPVKEPPKTRARRVKQSSPNSETPRSSSKRTKNASKSSKTASPVNNDETETKKSSPDVTSKKRSTRKAAAKAPSPVKTSPPKRTTRRGIKTSAASSNSPKTSKRGLSLSNDDVDSPAKKPKRALSDLLHQEQSPPKRATRRAKKEASPGKGLSPKAPVAVSGRKRRGATSSDEVATPSKRSKSAVIKKSPPAAKQTSPEKKTRSRRVGSKKIQSPVKEASPNKKPKKSNTTSPQVVSVSPRRTRRRK